MGDKSEGIAKGKKKKNQNPPVSFALHVTQSENVFHSLFGQQGAAFEQVAGKRRVLVADLRWRRRTLEVETAHDDVEDGGERRHLHAVKHGRQLRAQGGHAFAAAAAIRQRGHRRRWRQHVRLDHDRQRQKKSFSDAISPVSPEWVG